MLYFKYAVHIAFLQISLKQFISNDYNKKVSTCISR